MMSPKSGTVAFTALIASTVLACSAASPSKAGSSENQDASSSENVDGGRAALAPTTRIYATVVSHNEQDTNAFCKQGPNHDGTKFASNRALLKKVIDGVVQRGAAYDFQNDFAYLRAVDQYETEAQRSETSGKSIIGYAATVSPEHVVVDVHHHMGGLGNDENWADVAAHLNALGAPDNGVVGGFIASPEASAEIDLMRGFAQSGIVSLKTWSGTSKTWYPKVLWGGGTAGHIADADASGVWRPKSNSAFYTDDASSALPNVANFRGNKDYTGLAELVSMYKGGQLESGKMYTVTLMLNQCELSEASVSAVLAEIDKYKVETAEGWLAWKTLPAIVSDWDNVYGRAPQIHFTE